MSNQLYSKILTVAIGVLVLVLACQIFFYFKNQSKPEVKNNQLVYQPIQNDTEVLEDSINMLASFCKENKKENKVLQISRNIFQNATRANVTTTLESVKPINQNYVNPETTTLIEKPLQKVEETKETPDFAFVGVISDSYNGDTKIILTIGTQQFTVTLGSVVKQQWRIVSMSGDFLLVEDIKTSTQYNLKKGAPPIKSLSKNKELASTTSNSASEITSVSSVNTVQNLFERSNKPMTSKELWEKRAALANQQKGKNK